MPNEKEFQTLNIDDLVPFANHPFKLYEGQRLTDMAESIRANGVLVPIIVRPIGDEKYEILSGHNRVAAAREAELTTVSAVVREGLTDDEAMFIVTETNLIQRSFADLTHSEKAAVIAVHYNALKRNPGYRSDLLVGIEDATSVPVAPRSWTSGKIGEQYGLSADTIKRYLRVDKLIPTLKLRLNDGEIALRVAVTLSYLRESEQEVVESLLADGAKITIRQANALREESEKSEMSETSIKEMFTPGYFGMKIKPLKLGGRFLARYFTENQSAEEIESIVAEALEAWLAK